MFNDERINLHMGKLKKYIILISCIVSCLFIIYKIIEFMKYDFINYVVYLITDISIFLTSLIILLCSLSISCDTKDEKYYIEKSEYYNRNFKTFLYISFISFSLVMPFTYDSSYSSNVLMILLMNISLIMGYGYLRYNKIYFNYNIIEEDNNIYYRNVGLNIVKIIKFFAIIYGIGLLISIFLGSLSLIIAIIIAYISTVSYNSVYYLFISWVEKLFYIQENKKILTYPTILLCVIVFILSAVSFAFGRYCDYVIQSEILENLNISITIGQYVALLENIQKVISTYYTLFYSLFIIFLFSDLFKNNNNLRKDSKIVLIIFIFTNLYSLVMSYIPSIRLGMIDDEELVLTILNIRRYYNIILNGIFILGLYGTILVKLKKYINNKPLILIFIWILIINYFYNYIISTFLSKYFPKIISIGNYVMLTILFVIKVIMFIYIIYNYRKKENNIEDEYNNLIIE